MDAPPLPPWSAHAFVVFILLVLVTWAATTLFGRVRYLMWWGLVAAFLYFAMAPAVDWLVRKGLKRGLATGVVMLGLIVSVSGAVDRDDSVDRQRDGDDDRGRTGHDQQSEGLRRPFRCRRERPGHRSAGTVGADCAAGHLPDLAGGALSLTSALLGGLFEFFVILLFTFFLLANQDTFRRFLLSP